MIVSVCVSYCSGSLDVVQHLMETEKLNRLSVSTVAAILQEFLSAGRPVDGVLAALKVGSLRKTTLNTLLFFSAVDSANKTLAATALEVGSPTLLSLPVLITIYFRVWSSWTQCCLNSTSLVLMYVAAKGEGLIDMFWQLQSSKYLRTLKSQDYHLRNMKCAYQMRTGYSKS